MNLKDTSEVVLTELDDLLPKETHCEKVDNY